MLSKEQKKFTKNLLESLNEARSHKEDNEKAAPRDTATDNGTYLNKYSSDSWEENDIKRNRVSSKRRAKQAEDRAEYGARHSGEMSDTEFESNWKKMKDMRYEPAEYDLNKDSREYKSNKRMANYYKKNNLPNSEERVKDLENKNKEILAKRRNESEELDEAKDDKYGSTEWHTYNIGENEYSFRCQDFENRRNWGHYVELKKNMETIGQARCIYQNRTWESFKFQNCMLKAIGDAMNSIDKAELEQLKDMVSNGDRGSIDESALKEDEDYEDEEEYEDEDWESKIYSWDGNLATDPFDDYEWREILEIAPELYKDGLRARESWCNEEFGWGTMPDQVWELINELMDEGAFGGENVTPGFIVDNILVNGDYGDFDNYKDEDETDEEFIERVEDSTFRIFPESRFVIFSL